MSMTYHYSGDLSMREPSSTLDVARALADPLRMAAVEHLMQAPATVSELVSLTGASQPNVSNHLNVLRAAGLVRAVKLGRQRLYEIKDANAAQLIETLCAVAGRPVRPIRPTPALALVRTCYDHLAGRLGVALYESLRKEHAITEPRILRTLKNAGTPIELGPRGESVFRALGVAVDQVTRGRRPYAFGCRDWSEQKPHLGGRLGAALWGRLVELGWLVRQPGARAVVVTPRGVKAFRTRFAVDVESLRDDR